MSYRPKTVEAPAALRETASGNSNVGPATRSMSCPYSLAPDSVCR
jgi:hypothetical protein